MTPSKRSLLIPVRHYREHWFRYYWWCCGFTNAHWIRQRLVKRLAESWEILCSRGQEWVLSETRFWVLWLGIRSFLSDIGCQLQHIVIFQIFNMTLFIVPMIRIRQSSLPGYEKCHAADIVQNFFIARTLTAGTIRFDGLFKQIAHREYFLDAIGKLRIAVW